MNSSAVISPSPPEDIPATETELKDAKSVTYTESGYTGDEVCKICGKVIKKGKTIPAKHTFKNGKCGVCGAVEKSDEPIQKLPNSPDTSDQRHIALCLIAATTSMAAIVLLLRKKKTK